MTRTRTAKRPAKSTRRRRVLITGGAGFIGSHLCDSFLARGFDVICVDNLLTGSTDNIAHIRSPRFEFIAFHDESVKSFAELDPKLTPLEAEHWKGRKLPFPILLDATGNTIRRYGVHAFPTQILVDPEGKLVGEVDLETCEQQLLGTAATSSQPSSRR